MPLVRLLISIPSNFVIWLNNVHSLSLYFSYQNMRVSNMTLFPKLLLIAAIGLTLSACGGDKEAPKTVSEGTVNRTETVAKAPPSKPAGPSYCHGGEYNPEKPFRFVYFNLATRKDEMKRIRNTLKADLAAIEELPPEAKAEALKPHFAKTQALAALAIQPLADQMQTVAASLCNFELYASDKCTGLFSRSVSNVEIVEGALAYNAPDGRGKNSRVLFSSRDYSNVTIEDSKGTSQWSRSKDDVENFTLNGPNGETQWTENPDCSGSLTKVRKQTTVEATWTSPTTGALKINYNYCSKGECFEGTL